MPAYSIEKESSLLALTEGSKTSPEKSKSAQSESPSVSRGPTLSIQKREEKTLDLLALDDDDNDLEEKEVASDITPKLLSWLNNALMAAPRYHHHHYHKLSLLLLLLLSSSIVRSQVYIKMTV